MRRGFTMLELMMAVIMLSVTTLVSILTFRAVTRGWRTSREYLDRMERTDYVLDQLVSGLKCAYYPHSGKQDSEFGFMLTNGGDGDSPRESDTIEWSKRGSALIGASAVGDTVHRIQVKILEEGDRDWGELVKCTGLYARVKPHAKVIPGEEYDEEEDFTFENDEIYRPVLIAKDIDGFDCRVMKDEPEGDTKNAKIDKSDWEDEFSESNAVPYKVQLTFYVLKEDPEYASRKQRVPILRTVRLPVFEQSKDGSELPDAESDKGGGRKGGKK